MMKHQILLPLFSSVMLSFMSSHAIAKPSSNDANIVKVGNTVWRNETDIDFNNLINASIPKNSNSLFFIRRYDNDPEQLSANISVNDRFQVSLQPGNYTQVFSCEGVNSISAVPTRLKTNDLMLNTYPYNLKANQHYFFYVDVDTKGQAEIQQISRDDAIKVLADKTYQAHQISRVVPNCPVVEPTPVVTPIKINPPTIKPPVLEERVNIELEILFDNDKSIIKPQYFSKVAKVADFMNKYTNTTTVIEGHTDSKASDEYNLKLSKRRAEAVKKMLVVQYGIDPMRISTVGYGESRPRATNATASGQQQNRRIIAVIQENQ